MRSATYIVLAAVSAWTYTQDDRFPAPDGDRIVSVMPSSTEMVYAAGQQDRLVGVTAWCDSDKPKIGDIIVDLEKVLTLRARYVVGMRSANARTLLMLEKAGLTVIPTDVETFEDIAAVIRRLDGDPSALEARVAAVKPGRPLTVYFESGSGSYVDHVIRRAGGVNAFGDQKGPWEAVPWELVLSRQPDVLLIPRDRIDQVRLRPGFSELRGRVVAVDENNYIYPTPRLINGLEELARILRETR